ncbi:MAG: 5'/3'-nucleotidase SurE [Halococcoides sp.]
MTDGPHVLLTNDDGIDATGLQVLRESLTEIGSVTVVAPLDDRSAVGRSMSETVRIHDRDEGFAVEGTPADCVVAGLASLAPETDLVIAGVNGGANLGAYTLGRSGTISAAVEAAFWERPAIAASMYVPVEEDRSTAAVSTEPEAYREAVQATRYLAEYAPGAGVFDRAGYLNVNAPVADGDPAGMAITRPSTIYDMDAVRDGETISLEDHIWERMAAGDVPDPEGTDRRAIMNGRVSVSPLTAPHTTERHDALDDLAADYPA